MKSFFYLFIFSSFFLSCAQKVIPEKTVTIQTYEDKRGRTHLMGETDKNALMQEPYNSWFKKMDNYQPDATVIEELKKPLQDYEIEAFYGTWCGDSRRDVPKFYKILEETEYNLNRLKIIAVGSAGDMRKKSPDGEHEGKNITNVPTFIFYDKNGNEVGRIVESAVETLEKDMLKIVTGQEYKHSYDF